MKLGRKVLQIKKSTLKKLVAFILVTAIAIQGSQGSSISNAASNGLIYLFGIHEFENGMDKGHSDFCNWMGKTEKNYKTIDSTVTIGKRHYAGKGALYSAMKKANYLMISTHGAAGLLGLNAQDGTHSQLKNKTIEDGANLGQLRLCHIIACYSFDTANTMKMKGAQTTIGYRFALGIKTGRIVQYYFNYYFSKGKCAEDAIRLAVDKAYSKQGAYYGLDSYEVLGSKRAVYY